MQASWKSVLAAVIIGAPAITAAGQDEPYRTRLDTAVNLNRLGTVDVSLHAGKVNIVGGSGSQVRIRAVTNGDHIEFDATAGRVRLNAEPDGHRSYQNRPRGRHTRGQAAFNLTVPVGTRVVVETISASISITAVRGEVNVESVSGSIEIANAVRKVIAESVSGSLNISRAAGDVRAESVSGSLTLTGVAGEINSETVSGRIGITSASSKSVLAESVSGRISYDGTFDPAGSYVFKSHSGSLTLALPATAGATLRLETFSGHVESDFPVTLQPDDGFGPHDKRVEFKIGNGRSRIIAETFSGSIRIQRTGRRE